MTAEAAPGLVALLFRRCFPALPAVSVKTRSALVVLWLAVLAAVATLSPFVPWPESLWIPFACLAGLMLFAPLIALAFGWRSWVRSAETSDPVQAFAGALYLMWCASRWLALPGYLAALLAAVLFDPRLLVLLVVLPLFLATTYRLLRN